MWRRDSQELYSRPVARPLRGSRRGPNPPRRRNHGIRMPTLQWDRSSLPLLRVPALRGAGDAGRKASAGRRSPTAICGGHDPGGEAGERQPHLCRSPNVSTRGGWVSQRCPPRAPERNGPPRASVRLSRHRAANTARAPRSVAGEPTLAKDLTAPTQGSAQETPFSIVGIAHDSPRGSPTATPSFPSSL
jgi:hypothetical protein